MANDAKLAKQLLLAAQIGNVEFFQQKLSPSNDLIIERLTNNNNDIWTQFDNSSNQFDHKIPTGDRPLHCACRFGQLEVVKFVIEKIPITADQFNNRGELPGGIASRHGNLEVVKFLLEKRPDLVEKGDKQRNTPLNLASIGGHFGLVQYLVDLEKANLENRGDLGRTPLMNAAENGNFEIVDFLIGKGANLEARSHRHYDCAKMAIHLAAQGGHKSIIELILSKMPQLLESTDKSGDTPLNYASFQGHFELVKYLVLEKAADLRQCGQLGMNAFLHAVNRGHINIVEWILDQAGDLIDSVDSRGKTAIQLADYYGYSRIVTLLFRRKPTLRKVLSALRRKNKVKILPTLKE